MRNLSVAILCCAALPAAGFDFKGVPPEASLVFATESTAGLAITNSPGMQVLKARMQKSQAAEIGGFDVEKAVKAATGLDLSSPDISVAGGLLGGLSDEPDFVLIVRGAYDQARLASYCAGKGVKSVQAGTFKGWDLPGLVNSFGPGSPEPVAPDSPALFAYDSGTLVMTKSANVAKIFAALKGTGRSFTPGPESAGASSEVGKGYFFMAANSTLMPPTPHDQSGFKGMHAAMGEKGDAQVMKLEVLFTGPEKAAPFAMQVQRMVTMMPLMFARNPPVSHDKAKAKLAGDIIAGIAPVEQRGDRVIITASWSTERLLSMLNQLIDQAELETKNGANLFGAPAAAPKKK